MRLKSHVVVAAVILFSFRVLGRASHKLSERRDPSARPVARARPAAPHVVSTRASVGNRSVPLVRNRVHFNTASNNFETSDGSPISLQDLLNPVPPPGFDYKFLSVINQDLAIKALIDPATELKLAVAERLLRDGPRSRGSGFYLLDGGGAYAVPDDSASVDSGQPQQSEQPAQQPQVIVVQAPPARNNHPSNPLPNKRPAAGRRSIHSRASERYAASSRSLYSHQRSHRLYHHGRQPTHDRRRRSQFRCHGASERGTRHATATASLSPVSVRSRATNKSTRPPMQRRFLHTRIPPWDLPATTALRPRCWTQNLQCRSPSPGHRSLSLERFPEAVPRQAISRAIAERRRGCPRARTESQAQELSAARI